MDEENIKIEDIRDDLESFVKYDIGEYHKKSITTGDISELCQYVLGILDYAKGLEKRISELEKIVNDKE